MSVVNAIQENQDRPAYVRFERRPVEDKKESLKQGKYVARDVDYALITPPYSKDCIHVKVDQWVENMEQDVRNNRISREWRDQYIKQLEAWRNGQELPPVGTPIRGWGILSPAQQENLIRLTILTVEDLAGVNDEGCRRIGMGSMELRNKAKAWLSQLQDKGPLTNEIAALKSENTSLRTSVETMAAQIEELKKMVGGQPQVTIQRETGISADDILQEPEPIKKRK